MDQYSLVAPRTFILKLKIHCKECERKLKKLLQSIQGVHSVAIDAKQGFVTLKGTIDPQTIIEMLEKYGRKAELLWDQTPTKDGDDDNLQIITQSKVVDQLDDPKMVEQIQKLSGIKDLKKIEVTYSKTIKLTFNGQENEIKIEDKNMVANLQPQPQPQPHCGGACVASASCCGGHGMHNFHGHGGCCQVNSTCPMHSRGYPIHNNSWNGIPPAPSWPVYNPSAPPLTSGYNLSPPSPPLPQSQPYSTMFSDDNATGCVIV